VNVSDAGIDVTANQDDELTDKETFQIEFDTKSQQWRVRTADNVYWKLADASGIQANDDGRSVTCRIPSHIIIHMLLRHIAYVPHVCRLYKQRSYGDHRHRIFGITSSNGFQTQTQISLRFCRNRRRNTCNNESTAVFMMFCTCKYVI